LKTLLDNHLNMEWQDRAADKKSRIAASIPQEWRIDAKDTPQSAMDYPRQGVLLDVNELAITESSATELVKKLATGELTSIAVTNAFCKRAALAHQLLNCCLEFFPDMALQRAKELDEFYAKNKRTVGPLHGLPISLKDQFRIKGLETTMGYVDWIGKYETGNSVMVDLLFKAGAVLYTKTSVPQSLMLCETLNNIIGRTVNPRNKDWACGGSSGGEGALIGFRGGVIGVGTDIGGSIRVPAAFNYLYGIRPSHGRLPYGKMANSMEGQETVHSVSGPLCHSISDMRLFMTSVLAGKPWDFDSKVIPMPWRESEEAIIKNKVSSPSLTLGFYTSDGVVSSIECPSSERF
jgi:amidase